MQAAEHGAQRGELLPNAISGRNYTTFMARQPVAELSYDDRQGRNEVVTYCWNEGSIVRCRRASRRKSVVEMMTGDGAA